MNSMVSMMVVALFIEAVIQVFKPVWDKTAQPLTVPEWVSMAVGVLVAVLAQINMLDGLVQVDNIVLVYLFYVFTGIALGRGPSFVHDLWNRLRAEQVNV